MGVGDDEMSRVDVVVLVVSLFNVYARALASRGEMGDRMGRVDDDDPSVVRLPAEGTNCC
jgi:hypothetical protein